MTQDVAKYFAEERASVVAIIRDAIEAGDTAAAEDVADDIFAEMSLTEAAMRTGRQRRMEEALVRLRDCDWLITPADRMDAVREIARQALEFVPPAEGLRFTTKTMRGEAGAADA